MKYGTIIVMTKKHLTPRKAVHDDGVSAAGRVSVAPRKIDIATFRYNQR